MTPPRLRFVSLFVADLAQARARYERMVGPASPTIPPDVPNPHPFAAAGPLVFVLGDVALALYQADGRVTHPGDLAVGLQATEPVADLVGRARAGGARALRMPPGAGDMAAFMTSDRHFFEVMASGGEG